jgi:hypothetical protein
MPLLHRHGDPIQQGSADPNRHAYQQAHDEAAEKLYDYIHGVLLQNQQGRESSMPA